MQNFDYIISGSGASGLMLAYHMAIDPFFDEKQILILDKEVKNQNDRTWCFWEKDLGIWDEIVSKKWNTIYFGSQKFSDTIKILPYQYKLIRSKDFYTYIFDTIKTKSNIAFHHESIISISDEGDKAIVKTDTQIYIGQKIFNSVMLSTDFKNQKQYPVLNQHFVGWFVKTTTSIFDADTATFMDFELPQQGNTRFMYMLPLSKNEALFEYTLFSEDLLEYQDYETEIIKYLENKGITDYEIVEKEQGCIPMTCYDFRKHNSKNIIHIGTAGGWTKPSTGFTFSLTLKKIKELTFYLKAGNNNMSKFGKRNRFWYYDLLFIDLLYKKNYIGATLFSKLFQKNKGVKILKFLDEETSIVEEIKITTSLPAGLFLKVLWQRIFR
ncbi:lycopene cyclase [Aquimarina sp. AD10]|uniref:lycopene cyclase family protein n=1 Tax=Aquimarina sp. AD10 TaxID=1714849 RepID=UPI000E4BDF3E|nr:lycopene cyclase family protein [Aquimarina sp. AD10]AXT61532.1 lycopene cyclase [Aquimarina sp. AD10]RKM90015.1 lycopene cyclase [Aquimarina sp. AD10]